MAPHTELCALIRNRTVKCGDGPFPPILKATAEGLVVLNTHLPSHTLRHIVVCKSDRCIKDRSRPRNAVIVSFPDTAYSAPSECERHEESPRGYLNAASDRISQHGTEPSLCADVKPLPACFRMIRKFISSAVRRRVY